MEHYDKATLLLYQTLNPKCEAKCEAHSVLSEIKVPNPSGFSCVLSYKVTDFTPVSSATNSCGEILAQSR